MFSSGCTVPPSLVTTGSALPSSGIGPDVGVDRIPSMSVGAMRAISVLGDWTHASVHVLAWRHRFEVIQADAQGVAAEVVEVPALWNSSPTQQPVGTVRVNGRSTPPKAAIAFLPGSTACPDPAAVLIHRVVAQEAVEVLPVRREFACTDSVTADEPVRLTLRGDEDAIPDDVSRCDRSPPSTATRARTGADRSRGPRSTDFHPMLVHHPERVGFQLTQRGTTRTAVHTVGVLRPSPRMSNDSGGAYTLHVDSNQSAGPVQTFTSARGFLRLILPRKAHFRSMLSSRDR